MELHPNLLIVMDDYADAPDVLIAGAMCEKADGTDGKGRDLCNYLGVNYYPYIAYGEAENLQYFHGTGFDDLEELRSFVAEHLGPPPHPTPTLSPSPAPVPTPTPTPAPTPTPGPGPSPSPLTPGKCFDTFPQASCEAMADEETGEQCVWCWYGCATKASKICDDAQFAFHASV